jgi:uncharacterized membrane protein SirB2
MPDHGTLKLWHVALAGLSGALFVARGAAALVRPGWRPRGFWRAVPHGVDTMLLAMGVVLAIQLGAAALHGWLWVKLAAVVLYIALGMVAMSARVATPVRAAAFTAAILTFGYVASVAVTRSPTAFLSP